MVDERDHGKCLGNCLWRGDDLFAFKNPLLRAPAGTIWVMSKRCKGYCFGGCTHQMRPYAMIDFAHGRGLVVAYGDTKVVACYMRIQHTTRSVFNPLIGVR